ITALRDLVRDRIQRNIDVKRALLADVGFQDQVAQVAARIVKSLRAGGKVIFFGNGGSAADAQHLAAEFTGRYVKERRALAAIALNTNSSSMTSIGNDYGFDFVFARQIEALGKEGDVAIGISTSGNSGNVLRALESAKSKSMYTAALTGASGGAVKNIADCTICIPSEETPRIQECHVLAGHLICEIVELLLFGSPDVEFAEAGGAAARRRVSNPK
ncbi:MAG: D-sedoheptulose 7-phosphate isomerase, partial [Candidatus Acidiferrales bacterium]